MVIVYDMPSGRIHSENAGVTTLRGHGDVPECRLMLQAVISEPERTPTTPGPVDEYMNLIRELLRDM